MTADRPTRADVERAARAHTHALAALGIEAPRFAVEKGSRTNGIAWRLVAMRDDRRQRPPIGSDVIGFTARDAYDTVTERTSLVWDMRRALIDAGHELPAVIADSDEIERPQAAR